jgi:Na+/H+ antiporter NhaC
MPIARTTIQALGVTIKLSIVMTSIMYNVQCIAVLVFILFLIGCKIKVTIRVGIKKYYNPIPSKL